MRPSSHQRLTAWLILVSSWAFFGIGIPTSTTAAAADDRPNVILCMGDDHGWDETGYNGHPCVKTPVLDEMAAEGLRLDRFYSASPVCSPTRGSVLTGRHPNRYGTFSANWSLRPEEISIAHLLRRAGYLCGHFGKWHVGPVKKGSPTNPGAMGFHQWLSHDNFFEMNPWLSRNGAPPKRFQGESSEILVDETIRFIEKATREGQPFLAVVWFGSPHQPYSGLPEDLAIYEELPDRYPEPLVRVTSMQTGLPVKRPLGEVLQERYAEITAMDRSIGRLRCFLREEGLRRNTLLWYCGDNGIPGGVRLATPFRSAKGAVYEGGIRVPGLIEWPQKVDTPRTTEVNAVTSDILPTLCAVLGLPLPQRPLDGVSLAGLMVGTMTERPTPIGFWNYDIRHEGRQGCVPYIEPKLQAGTTPLVKKLGGRFTRNFSNCRHEKVAEDDFAGARAILDNRYKLVVHGGPRSGEKIELFDVRNDPAEQNDLAEQHPKTVARLRQALRVWQQSVLRSLTGADYGAADRETEQ